jgi:ribosome biogenesis GTPase A
MVLDARDPIGTKIAEIEEYAQKNSKKLVYLLNKIDMSPNSSDW